MKGLTVLTTEDNYTSQYFEHNSAQGKKFLKALVKSNNEDGWKASAVFSEGNTAVFVFKKTIKGELGQPDKTVSIVSDIGIVKPEFQNVKIDNCNGEKTEVYFAKVSKVEIEHSDIAALASLALQDADFKVSVSAGSHNTSKLGLTFYSVTARIWGKNGGFSVKIGSETICKNAARITHGDVYTA